MLIETSDGRLQTPEDVEAFVQAVLAQLDAIKLSCEQCGRVGDDMTDLCTTASFLMPTDERRDDWSEVTA